MRRILVLLAVVAVMVAVGALPAIASPTDKVVNCYTDTGEVVAAYSTNEASGFQDQGTFRADCISEGYVVTQEVEPNPGPSNPYPPGKGRPPLP
jgi:hypothetical protein